LEGDAPAVGREEAEGELAGPRAARQRDADGDGLILDGRRRVQQERDFHEDDLLAACGLEVDAEQGLRENTKDR
jgi:hypothetical protein